jgi:hypothetical protein
MGMWKHNLFCFGKKRGHKPAKKNSRGESAEKLRCYKAWRICRTNPDKRVCEGSSVKARASITTGFAKEVEAVNQYAPVM